MNSVKKVLFVHIPKTAGTSIRRHLELEKVDIKNNLILSQRNIKRDIRFLTHDPLFLLQSLNDFTDYFTFSVVRNPYTRTYSFYQFIKQNNKIDISFTEFLETIRMYPHLSVDINRNWNIFREISSDGTSKLTSVAINMALASYTQSFYLYNEEAEIKLNKIYKFENLSEFENDFNVNLTHSNNTFYKKEDVLAEYTPKNIFMVKQHFAIDFINFNYSTNFEDSL